MAALRRRRLALAAVSLLLAAVTVAGPSAGAAAAIRDAAPPRPVILVHGLGGDGSAWDRSPLPGLLAEAGHVPGRTLFTLDYGADSTGDYTDIYRQHLMPAIDRALAASGADRADVVAFSMGGLVARYYVHSPDYRDDVGTLVLLGSPVRGSFAASLVRGLAETDVQRHGPPDVVAEPAHALVRERLPAYRDLAHRFRVAARLPVNRTRTLLDWLEHTEPALFGQWFRDNQHPVLKEGGATGIPTPAAALTGSFYELLAAQTAIALAERPRLQTWAPFLSVSRILLRPPGWPANETEAIHWAVLLMEAAGIGPASEAIDRLVEERTAAGSQADVLANHFLWQWNELLAGQRRSQPALPDAPFPGVRQVVVAGSMLNVWAPLRAGTGPNDGVVEVASTLLPPRPDDRFRLFAGPGLHHLQLKQNADVARYIVDALADAFQPAAVWSPSPPPPWQQLLLRRHTAETVAQLAAGYWEPAYFEVASPDGDASGTLRLKAMAAGAAAPGPADSVTAWAHVERRDGSWDTHPLLRAGGPAREAHLRLPGFGADAVRVLVGVRREQPPSGLVRLALRPQTTPVEVRASFTPDGTELTPRPSRLLTGPAPAPVVAAPPASLPPEPPVQAERPSAASPTQPPAAEPASAAAPADLPLIEVERTNRLTTAWKEEVTRHASWSWDFGDGTGWADDDPSHVKSVVTHQFAGPGDYLVTATAMSNQGDIIRRQTFPATVSASAGPLTFAAESITQPAVAFTLTGPQAWLVGNTAPFTAAAEVVPPPFGEVTGIRLDPGETFHVLWKRPNHFEVRAAARVDVVYRWPEGGEFRLRNTYVRSQAVEVMATGLSR